MNTDVRLVSKCCHLSPNIESHSPRHSQEPIIYHPGYAAPNFMVRVLSGIAATTTSTAATAHADDVATRAVSDILFLFCLS